MELKMRLKSTIAAVVALVALSSVAHAEERVLVVLKSKQAFQNVDRTYKAKGQYALTNFDLGFGPRGPLTGVSGKVEDSLSHIQTIVLNVKDTAEIEKLKNNPDVALVEKEVFHPAPRPFRASPTLVDMQTYKRSAPATPADRFSPTDKTPWGIGAVKAPEAWERSNQGEGARVLVLDTGIDRDHPSLKANFEAGKDFVGDSATPYDYFDRNGHGTHVSGTIAGVMDRAGFTGVAPKAKILMGRVCSEGGCSNIAIARGINWGVEQKVDIISMSLGGAWSTPAERTAITEADKAGVTVVAASGNDGSSRVSYPAALPTVIAVGAVDSTLAKATFSQYGPELAIVAPGVAVASSVPQGSGRASDVKVTIDGVEKSVKSSTFTGGREVLNAETNVLVEAGLGKAEDFAKIDVKGKFALISRGEIKFGEKVQNAIAAGAVGAVIYNNAPGLLQGALTEDGSVLPAAVFMVEQTIGQELVKALADGKSASATVVINKTDYSSFDGTSMATPHVSGVIALVKAAKKDLTPAQVREIITSTAQALSPNDQNQFGAGMINADLSVKKALGQ